MGAQGAGDQARSARDYARNVSLQSLTGQLPEEMGKELSETEPRGEISGPPDCTDPQDRPTQGLELPHANAPGRDDVYGQLQRRTRGLSAAVGPATNRATGSRQPQFRHGQAHSARHLLLGRPDLRSSAGLSDDGSFQTDLGRAARGYPRLLQRRKCPRGDQEESQGLGAGQERTRRTEIRAFAAACQLKRGRARSPLEFGHVHRSGSDQEQTLQRDKEPQRPIPRISNGSGTVAGQEPRQSISKA